MTRIAAETLDDTRGGNLASAPALRVEDAARRWFEAGRAVALAVVIETWGSAPVAAGGMMAIAADDAFAGSVSGGCVEADVIAAALESTANGKAQSLSFGVKDETAWRAGLACGGKIRIAVLPLVPADGLALLDRLDAANQKREAIVVRWTLATGHLEICDQGQAQDEDIAAALQSGTSKIVSGDGGEMFLQAFVPPPRVLIFGATHIAQHLQSLCTTIGYDAHVIDPRGAFASAERFDAASTTTAWPSAAVDDLGLDAFTAVVALTHVGAIDDEALKAALDSPCRYIGALGSRKTHGARVERLRAAGFDEAKIGRISAPIGLDIGAKTAGEIAASILAEIIQSFRKPQSA